MILATLLFLKLTSPLISEITPSIGITMGFVVVRGKIPIKPINDKTKTLNERIMVVPKAVGIKTYFSIVRLFFSYKLL